jgi:hypothetical protein
MQPALLQVAPDNRVNRGHELLAILHDPVAQVGDFKLGNASILWAFKPGIESRGHESGGEVACQIDGISSRNHHSACAGLDRLICAKQSSFVTATSHHGSESRGVESRAVWDVIQKKTTVALNEMRDDFFSLLRKVGTERNWCRYFTGCHRAYDFAGQRLAVRHAFAVRAERDSWRNL